MMEGLNIQNANNNQKPIEFIIYDIYYYYLFI